MATIATHNRPKLSVKHNLRDPAVVSKEPHIDPKGLHETWLHKPIREAYEEIFGEALRVYNTKQQRADRQIKDYYAQIRKSDQQHPAYEMIIGVYGDETHSDSEKKEIMRQFVDEWHERNPNLRLIGAYYHADEQGEPHVHIDYIPVATGYKKGLETRNGMRRALEQQGFTKKGRETAQIAWERSENEALETLCKARGISVEHPQQGKGREHLSTADYVKEKAADDIKELLPAKKQVIGSRLTVSAEDYEKASELSRSVYTMKQQVKRLEAEVEALKKALTNSERRVEFDLGQQLEAARLKSQHEALLGRVSSFLDKHPEFREELIGRNYVERGLEK